MKNTRFGEHFKPVGKRHGANKTTGQIDAAGFVSRGIYEAACPHRALKRTCTFILFTALIMPMVVAQKTGSWGDQGDGTYKNPILEANFPDNDVIRVGDSFYMMSSTNHFVPGMVILKSKDLVNWEYSNYVMPAPITFDPDFTIGKNPALMSRLTWAGSFGYNGEYYFAYWCLQKKDSTGRGGTHIVYAKAKSIEGPWSEPKELTFANGSPIPSTDPGVLFDRQTHKAWIACCRGHIYRLSWDGAKVLQNAEQGIEVYAESGSTESFKLYKFDGVFYLMNSIAEFRKGVKQRMEEIHRAKSMEGPWEGRLVLENGNGTDRSPSQGTLLKLDDGSWWYIHQLARGRPMERYDGRPQFLEPVAWRDGWPLIGVDADGDGVGKVVWEHKKPIDGFPIVAPAADDDFNKPKLGLQWYWSFNPRMDRWSLTERPGFLRLKACVPLDLREDESLDTLPLDRLPNVIAQRLMGRHKNVMTAKIDISGMANGQEGGLHISAGDNNIIGVMKDDKGVLRLFFKSNAENASSRSDRATPWSADPGSGPMVMKKGAEFSRPEVWLRAKVEDGLATFYYSFDGRVFTHLGDEVQLYFHGFTANGVGFYTMSREEKGYIDIDWFKYEYDGPKGAHE